VASFHSKAIPGYVYEEIITLNRLNTVDFSLDVKRILNIMLVSHLLIVWIRVWRYQRGNQEICFLLKPSPSRGILPFQSHSRLRLLIQEYHYSTIKTTCYTEFVIQTLFPYKQTLSTRIQNKDWLAWNRENLSEWGDMSICWLLFQWASTITNPAKRVGLVQSGP
jgi:hypothetical protein